MSHWITLSFPPTTYFTQGAKLLIIGDPRCFFLFYQAIIRAGMQPHQFDRSGRLLAKLQQQEHAALQQQPPCQAQLLVPSLQLQQAIWAAVGRCLRVSQALLVSPAYILACCACFPFGHFAAIVDMAPASSWSQGQVGCHLNTFHDLHHSTTSYSIDQGTNPSNGSHPAMQLGAMLSTSGSRSSPVWYAAVYMLSLCSMCDSCCTCDLWCNGKHEPKLSWDGHEVWWLLCKRPFHKLCVCMYV